MANNGRDIDCCGETARPCRTVRFAVQQSGPYDTILVARGRPYQECGESSAIAIQHSLTIRGKNGLVEIQCRGNQTLFSIQRQLQESKKISLSLLHLNLTNSKVAVRSLRTKANLTITGCRFHNNSIGILINRQEKCFHVLLVLKNSVFRNHQSSGFQSFPCQTYTFRITNTSFYSSSISLGVNLEETVKQNSETNELLINNCSFFGENEARQEQRNGIFIHTFAKTTKIVINKTIIKNHLEYGSKHYFLWLTDEFVNLIDKTTLIMLEGLIFKDNYWKKTMMFLEVAHARKYSVSLENSLFQNNTGTIEFAIPPNKHKQHDPNNTYNSSNTVLIRNNTFLGNRYFPQQGLAGIYATLFFNVGLFEVVSCKFINNRHGQSPSTGIISISDAVKVTLRDCYFEVSGGDDNAVQVLAYPNSFVTIRGNNTINITKTNGEKTIFAHLPGNNLPSFRTNEFGCVLIAGILKVVCPQGFRAGEQQVVNDRKEHKGKTSFTYLQIYCEPCPRKTYSLERGMIIKMPNNTKILTQSSSGMSKRIKSKKHAGDIECHQCPRGGQCVYGYLRAKPNFWGYKIGNEVRFIDCPHDYCCDQCSTYHQCHGRRTGTLCARCPRGTTESLFSTACRKNSTCNATVFFPAATILIFVYIVFFLYHGDIVCFLKKGLTAKLPSLSDRADDVDTESGGCIKIIFYYYQTIRLLTSSVGFEERQTVVQRVTDLISHVFGMVVSDISSFDCPLPGITPVSKTLLTHSVGFVLLFVLGFGCLIWKLGGSVGRRKRVAANVSNSSPNLLLDNYWDAGHLSLSNPNSDINGDENERDDAPDTHKPSFTERALGAFIHISLLMYVSTTRLSLGLLDCVPYKNTKVLYIDGTIQCYQNFQYVLMGYVLLSVFPFCMVPFLGSYVLNLRLISVTQFCFGCILPLPFCCNWLRLLLRNKSDVNRYQDLDHNLVSKNRAAILHVLTGPFRVHEANACVPRVPLAWEGVLIFRRLVLILIFAFIYDRRWRILAAITACVLILVMHLCVKPFKKRWENNLETASLSILVIFCGLTLVKTLYRGEDYSSLYTNSTFMTSVNILESALIISPLAVIFAVALILLIIRFILFLVRCFRS